VFAGSSLFHSILRSNVKVLAPTRGLQAVHVP
jgi:hypothetical protein